MEFNKVFLRIKNLFIINDTFRFEGTEDEFRFELDNLLLATKSKNGFNAALDHGKIYKISPAVSWGVPKFFPITICLEYTDEIIQKVNIYTTARVEIIILAILFPLLCIKAVRFDDLSTLFIPVILLASLAWFNVVSKMQERDLIKRVKLKLRLIEE